MTTTNQTNQKQQKNKKKVNKKYFHEGTQDAIVRFQKTNDFKEKEKIYVSEILPAFEKLVENLINIHKFKSVNDNYNDLKNDCIVFLFETLGKFDASRGTNAFSYFNVVAKNWLIIKTKQRLNHIKRSISLCDIDALNTYEAKIILDQNIIPSQDDLFEKRFQINSLIEMLNDIRENVKTVNELLCINAVITIFENVDSLDFLNKSAILMYLRELSGLTPKQLTTTMQTIKKYYKNRKLENVLPIFE